MALIRLKRTRASKDSKIFIQYIKHKKEISIRANKSLYISHLLADFDANKYKGCTIYCDDEKKKVAIEFFEEFNECNMWMKKIIKETNGVMIKINQVYDFYRINPPKTIKVLPVDVNNNVISFEL